MCSAGAGEAEQPAGHPTSGHCPSPRQSLVRVLLLPSCSLIPASWEQGGRGQGTCPDLTQQFRVRTLHTSAPQHPSAWPGCLGFLVGPNI